VKYSWAFPEDPGRLERYTKKRVLFPLIEGTLSPEELVAFAAALEQWAGRPGT
jgi:hypothetical protein